MKFKKTDTIEKVLKNHENAEEIFLGFGMHCLHCMMAQGETLEQACMVHGIEVEDLLEMLNTDPKKFDQE